MSHKIFRAFFILILVIGSLAIQSPKPARAAGPWYVSTTGDDNNDCLSPGASCATINGAIGKASSGDKVNAAEGTYTSTGNEVVLIDKDITLSGGWDASFTTQNGTSIIDGEAIRRGITVIDSVTTSLDHLTLQNGNKTGGGGGIYNNGTVTLSDSLIADNIWGTGDGAGIWNSQTGVITLNNTTITRNGNQDLCNGIAISNQGVVIANNSSITENRVTNIICGIGSAVINLTDSGYRGTIILNNTTISNNSPGGGIYNYGNLTLNNSTISNNMGDDSNGPGGIYNSIDGILTLNNSTVTGNTTSGSGGGIFNIGFGSGTVTLQNSIIAGNTASTGADCAGTMNSLGYNLIGETFLCNFNATTGDMTDLDPLLGPLQDNGGQTFTHALLPISPAIDAGNPAGCIDQGGNLLTTDQRGIIRPQGIRCDIGSYEYTFTTPGPATSLSVLTGNGQRVGINSAFPQPLRVVALDNQNNRVSGVTVTFAAPASGPSGTFTDTGTNTTSAVTDAGGVATSSIFTANNQEGMYTVTASASGLGSVNFSLEQIVRPPNDSLANAKLILSLPFSDSLDSTNATLEPGEPSPCGSTFQTGSVWYSFTPATNVVVNADMFGSSFSDANLTLYQQVGPGFEGLSALNTACFGGSIIFTAQAGATYVLQAQSFSSGGGDLHLNLQEVSPPTNDGFVDAEPILSLPFSDTVDITGATTELNEPQFCNSMDKTVWYTLSPSTTTNLRADGGFNANVNIYRAAGLGITNLQFVDCANAGSRVDFLAEAGQVYFIQAGPAFEGTSTIQVDLAEVVAITGRVTDAVTSIPLPGNAPPFAQVTLQRVCGSGCLEFVSSQNADSDGRFRFDNYFGGLLPAGIYQIEVSANLYQTKQFGPFEFSGVSLDVGDLPIAALPLIGSISGRLVDAATGKPVSPTFTPSVQLYRCTDGNCFEFVNSQVPDSQGQFRFATDSSGNPLPVGTYQVLAFADQYQQAQTDPFDVGEGMQQNLGNLRITSFPVRFSEVQPCTEIPTSGGECSYSVRVWNGLSTRLRGAAWSLAQGSLPNSFVGFTNFQVKDSQALDLDRGKSKVFRFRFNVPANNTSYGTSICTRLFAGEGSNFFFNTVGFRNLFCVLRNAGGFSIASPQEAIAFAQAEVTAASTGTDVEPNNSCQSAQDLSTVSLPFVLDGNLDSSQTPDVDFFRLTGAPGTVAAIDLEGQSTSKGTLGDPFLGFFDSNCNLVALNDDFNSLNSHLEITIPADGVFILGATTCCDSGFTGGGDGSYQLTVATIPVIGSISGHVVDAVSGKPLRGDVEPFAFVRLLQCADFFCNDVNTQLTDSEGRFRFDSDFSGAPLRVGNYLAVVSANQYISVQTEQFAVGEGENYDAGNIALDSFPVRFSDAQACAIPSRGGVCTFSVKITNGLSTQLFGRAWSIVNGSGIGSFTNFTDFQSDTLSDIRLNSGKSSVLHFRFRVPGSVANGATICATVYVGQNPYALFDTVGLDSLFCFVKGESGFTLLSPQETQAASQKMQIQEITPPAPFTEKKK